MTWAPVVIAADSTSTFPIVAKWERLVRGSFPDVDIQRLFITSGWADSSIDAIRAATPPSAVESTLLIAEAPGWDALRSCGVMVAMTRLGLAVLGPPFDAAVEDVEGALSRQRRG